MIANLYSQLQFLKDNKAEKNSQAQQKINIFSIIAEHLGYMSSLSEMNVFYYHKNSNDHKNIVSVSEKIASIHVRYFCQDK